MILEFWKRARSHFCLFLPFKQHIASRASTMAAATSSTSRLLSSCTCAVRRSAFRIQRSQIHTRPRLPYDIEQGVQPFLSAEAVKGTAIEWQQGNLNRLNDLIRGRLAEFLYLRKRRQADRTYSHLFYRWAPCNYPGTQHENKSVAQTVVDAAKSPTDALIFGHASEALNNGYFLSCLVSTTSVWQLARHPQAHCIMVKPLPS